MGNLPSVLYIFLIIGGDNSDTRYAILRHNCSNVVIVSAASFFASNTKKHVLNACVIHVRVSIQPTYDIRHKIARIS